MSRLPKKTRNSLKKEAVQWDTAISGESAEQIQEFLNDAEPFKVPRPARQPVSLRMDPFDISMVKRLARKKGVPHTQLMAMWLRERIEREKSLHAPE
ncbi:MAG: hypothetical protein GY846_09635 [Deltaproteobacteria bacterium]|nr:hypothetical protein [Deltaproteobacteria bacterium]